MERSFHISHAAFQPKSFSHNVLEIHAVVEKTDYLLCYLGVESFNSSCRDLHMIQQPLNLNISEGEEITLYVKTFGIPDKDQEAKSPGSVYLTGYFVDEPTFEPNLDDLLEDDECLDEELLSEDDSEDVLGEGGGEEDDLNGQSLATLLLEGSLADSDSDEDADFMARDDQLLLAEGGSSRSTRKRLAKAPVIKEVKVHCYL